MSNFGILAFDPGGTTGWALFHADRMPTINGFEYSNQKWSCGQLGPGPHHNEMYHLMEQMAVQYFTVVIESFEYRNKERPGLELVSREYIGVAELFGKQRNVPVVQQSASQGKVKTRSFVRKVNLERLGLYRPGWGHAMDAYGHMLYYMINTGNVMREELLRKGWRVE